MVFDGTGKVESAGAYKVLTPHDLILSDVTWHLNPEVARRGA